VNLLFDQNLAPRLCVALASDFPGLAHVRDFNLQRADDLTLWEFARVHRYTIVSKDEDFHQRSFLHGFPPKVVWVRLGNCSTDEIADALRRRKNDIAAFHADPDAAFLVIS